MAEPLPAGPPSTRWASIFALPSSTFFFLPSGLFSGIYFSFPAVRAAYFLKLKEYGGDFNKLWDNHLKGLLFEYLRGNRDADEQMKRLENAYKGIAEPED